ncbi:MAG: copper chaperone PCu(A)C [Paracoccus sp. (in: a-proteobacteria)]|nr:copper chaperone PCu(A)C [Paracoccus sp. (in: a-proteobacteria)]
MKTLTFAAIAALMPLTVLAEGVVVTDAYARSANPQSGAAFFQVENQTAQDCTLVNVTSDVAERTELHTHREESGVMKMVQIESIPVAAGQVHLLQRGADHVMFLGLHQPLTDGQEVAFSLDFGDCGAVDVTATVDNQRQPQMQDGAHNSH